VISVFHKKNPHFLQIKSNGERVDATGTEESS